MAMPYRFASPRPRRGRPTQAWLSAALLPALLCLGWSGPGVRAATVALNPAHPTTYTVAPGDTLWSIAGRFLAQPWQWPEIWRRNPSINNPDLIYPGDVLVLDEDRGVPRLRVGTPSELRLHPQVRSEPLSQAIPTIPMHAVRPFLTRPQVMEPGALARAPYVVDFAGEHIMGGTGTRVYVRAIPTGTPAAYTVLRPGPPYRDAETGEILGYEGLYLGDARLEATGDPATLYLERTVQEVSAGDRLVPMEPEPLRLAFQPHAPKRPIRGHIIGVLNGVTQIGQHSVVALDRGSADGIEVGHVLDIFQRGRVVRDTVSARAGDTVLLPSDKAGSLLVFRPFQRVSYALVMEATRPIHVADLVQSP
ncbi:LysM domain-containing protein [Candidatus Methylocalor cossyra]|uniref:LysM domain-containing protein n=1 Tax=Candidatus Methylocalor cossyra TaxID=3108543 RepID=A0ABM9NEB6_9GAMM